MSYQSTEVGGADNVLATNRLPVITQPAKLSPFEAGTTITRGTIVFSTPVTSEAEKRGARWVFELPGLGAVASICKEGAELPLKMGTDYTIYVVDDGFQVYPVTGGEIADYSGKLVATYSPRTHLSGKTVTDGYGAHAVGILCDDVTFGEDETEAKECLIYTFGEFNRDAISGGEIDDATAQSLRDAGIFLKNAY